MKRHGPEDVTNQEAVRAVAVRVKSQAEDRSTGHAATEMQMVGVWSPHGSGDKFLACYKCMFVLNTRSRRVFSTLSTTVSHCAVERRTPTLNSSSSSVCSAVPCLHIVAVDVGSRADLVTLDAPVECVHNNQSILLFTTNECI